MPALGRLVHDHLGQIASSAALRLKVRDLEPLLMYLDNTDLYSIVISEKDLSQRVGQNRSADEDLSAAETSNLKQAAEVIQTVISLWGPEHARPWLHRSFRHFGGRTPIEVLAEPEGFSRVVEFLASVDEGAFA